MHVRTKVVGVAAAVTVFATAGIAWAAWTSQGSGSGTAQTSTDQASSITAEASAPDLYPGADKTITVGIDNPNPYPVIVTGISGSSSPLQNGCAAASVTSDARSNAAGLLQSDGITKVIAAGGEGVYVLATHMVDDPDDACKLQTFALTLTADLESAAS